VFRGSTGGTTLVSPVRSVATTATGAGYWMVAAYGGIFAPYRSSAAGIGLDVVGIPPTGECRREPPPWMRRSVVQS